MQDLLSKNHWKKNRSMNMRAARECRAALTNPEGYWQYAANDERIKEAIAPWVARARIAHAIALGRRPVIENAVIIAGGSAERGQLWAA